jgi:uridine kinase
MIGDKLIVKDFHTKAARGVLESILESIKEKRGKFILSIAGESGSGKSEIASELSRLLSEHSLKSYIIQQDDYFVYPPKTNEKMRRMNIQNVGMSEVKIDLLNKNLDQILQGTKKVYKPLVIFNEDRITEESISTYDINVFIVDGTYSTVLKNVDVRVFIDRTYLDTRKSRLERERESQDDFLEKVLEIEHKIISTQKAHADIIIQRDYSVSIQRRT